MPFSRLIGQAQAIEILSRAVEKNRLAPAYLFVGAAGVGRALAARCFIELLFGLNSSIDPQKLQKRLQQGNHPDLLWVKPTYLHQGQRLSAEEATAAGLKRKTAPQIRIEQIREIAQFLGRPPLEASRSVVVLEEAETMAEAAANSLLKTLEEPGRATLILIAPSESALLPTLVSRCAIARFSRLKTADVAMVLENAGYGEILAHPEILAIAQGSPGEAIASWQQLQAIPPDLLQNLTQLPKKPYDALELAKQIDKTLDTEAQLWLINYLQHRYWQSTHKPGVIQHLEQAKNHLLKLAQPRLVWEVTLLNLVSTATS